MTDRNAGPDEAVHMPASAFWLGATGVIPFVASAVLSATGLDFSLRAEQALIAYGAVILSFLGGIHWGLAIAGVNNDGVVLARRLGLSVVPSLVGWFALLVGGPVGLGVLALAFTIWVVIDLPVAKGAGAPVWYPRLRYGLTTVAVLSLAIGAVL